MNDALSHELIDKLQLLHIDLCMLYGIIAFSALSFFFKK